MFKTPINIAFSPNFERDDVLLSLKLLLNSENKQFIKNSQKKLIDWFKNHLKYNYIYPFSSGRAALYFILKSLELRAGDEVLTQAFTCIAVPNSIIWAGLTPRFVDIDRKNFNIDLADLQKKITPRSRVVIIQHTFGIPGPIEEIMALAKKHHLYVIEDCAHAIGATYKGKPVGSYGDASFFSFGRDKIVSSVFGGVATTNNKQIARKLDEYTTNLLTPPRQFVDRQLLYPIIYQLSKPLYKVFIGKVLLKLAAITKILTPAVLPEEKRGLMPKFINYSLSPRLTHLAIHQLEKLFIYNLHRQKIANLYHSQINSHKLYTGAVYLRYPIPVKNKPAVLKVAKNHGVYLGDWYSAPIYPMNKKLGQYDFNTENCPTAKKLSQITINLPTSIHTSEADAQIIINFLKKFLTRDS